MIIKENVSLKRFNTFGIDVRAKSFISVTTHTELKRILCDKKFKDIPKLILGGGSNILLTKDFDGIVIRNNIQGIKIISDNKDHVVLKAGAGVIWHNLVLYCISHNLGGIENLSLIPGKVGAAPIQNIGAYGVEIKDVLINVSSMDINTGQEVLTANSECRFGYRDSIFKHEKKGKTVITSATIRLTKKHNYNINYGAIRDELERMNVKRITLKAVSNAVCNIRQSKLPDPAVTGNAGSFFKNPEVTAKEFEELKAGFPAAIGYDLKNGNVKIAAGWMIEQCGWKGKRVGNTGAHKDQALVLVNYGNSTGAEILALAKQIQRSVKQKFGVKMDMEVNVY